MAMTVGFVIVIAGLLLYGLIKQSLVILVVCALLVPVYILVLRREASKERDAIHPYLVDPTRRRTPAQLFSDTRTNISRTGGRQ